MHTHSFSQISFRFFFLFNASLILQMYNCIRLKLQKIYHFSNMCSGGVVLWIFINKDKFLKWHFLLPSFTYFKETIFFQTLIMFSFDLGKVISMCIWEVGLCLLHFLQINPNQSIKIWLLVILEFQREKKIVMEICFCCQIWQDFRIMWFISDQSKKK